MKFGVCLTWLLALVTAMAAEPRPVATSSAAGETAPPFSVEFKAPPDAPVPSDAAEPVAATGTDEASETPETTVPPPARPAQSLLEAQIELSRRHFSCGPVDGIFGSQTAAALKAFQATRDLPVTGQFDALTRETLTLEAEPLTTYTVTPEDAARLLPLSDTWAGKAEQPRLDYENILELVAERFHANPKLIRKLNPAIDWDNIGAGESVTVPAIERTKPPAKAAHLHVRLAEHVLQARDATGQIIAHFPVSIASRVEKRPVGELRVVVVIPDPDYTFDPVNFPESEEAQALGRRLIIPPGPNNPVGVAWIGLDRPGYGIHGTPIPEHVGRTESHGCFRLANWDALTLLDLAWVGLPVFVDP